MRKLLVLFAASALVFAACSKQEAAPASKPKAQSVSMQAKDYSYSAPARLESGKVSITLTDNGKEPHQAQLLKLNDGVQVGQLVESVKKDSTELGLQKLGSFAGGPNGISPGGSQTATVQLQAGKYAFFCLIPDAQGRPHITLGMVSELDVTQADQEAEVPSADYSASAKEFAFQAPEAWQGTIAFENRGKQPHEFQVLGIAPGKTADDVVKSFQSEAPGSGPPPWTAEGGAAVIAPGGTESFESALKPGTYFLMCFVTDPAKKAPHFALGMMQKFEVK